MAGLSGAMAKKLEAFWKGALGDGATERRLATRGNMAVRGNQRFYRRKSDGVLIPIDENGKVIASTDPGFKSAMRAARGGQPPRVSGASPSAAAYAPSTPGYARNGGLLASRMSERVGRKPGRRRRGYAAGVASK